VGVVEREGWVRVGSQGDCLVGPHDLGDGRASYHAAGPGAGQTSQVPFSHHAHRRDENGSFKHRERKEKPRNKLKDSSPKKKRTWEADKGKERKKKMQKTNSPKRGTTERKGRNKNEATCEKGGISAT